MPIPPFVDVGCLTTVPSSSTSRSSRQRLQCRCCHDAMPSVSAGKGTAPGSGGRSVGSSDSIATIRGPALGRKRDGDRRHRHFVTAFRRVVTEPNAEQHRQRMSMTAVTGTQPETVKHGNDKPRARTPGVRSTAPRVGDGGASGGPSSAKVLGRKHPTRRSGSSVTMLSISRSRSRSISAGSSIVHTWTYSLNGGRSQRSDGFNR